MGIQQKLSRFPVSESTWDECHLDQEINDRRIGVDMAFVKNAITFDKRSKMALTKQMQKLSSPENPNFVQHMKNWLSENGLKTDSLGKKVVAEMMKDAPEHIVDVLSISLATC